MPGAANIRVVEPGDASVVRNVIIAMLSDSPQAFGESLVEARNRTEQAWQTLVDHLIAPGLRAAFLAFDDQGACGFVCTDSSFPEAPPETVVISRLWVAPRQRGSGLGRRLMEAATTWAQEKRASLIALGVTEMNAQAIEFYEHLGYSDLGMRVPWPPDPSKNIIVLGRSLRT
jgi:ribosomal protein S18 acetylase RimI-like enzyme